MNRRDPDYWVERRYQSSLQDVRDAELRRDAWMFDPEVQEQMNDERMARLAKKPEPILPSGPHTLIINANYDLDVETPSLWFMQNELEWMREGDIGGGVEEECD